MNRTSKTSLIGLFLFCLTTIYVFGQEKDLARPSLGTYSISLNVSDLEASISFYDKLGFLPVEGLGSLSQKWVILSNGSMNLGLFQGFFPSNTITFNPTDARSIHKTITESGIKPIFQLGIENESGPCSFSIVDPDGNSILIDQH